MGRQGEGWGLKILKNEETSFIDDPFRRIEIALGTLWANPFFYNYKNCTHTYFFYNIITMIVVLVQLMVLIGLIARLRSNIAIACGSKYIKILTVN